MVQQDKGTRSGGRSYGALATTLGESLRAVRAAVEGHVSLLPGAGLADIDGVLAELDARRVRIAVYGEVKAGKSTLVNAIAGAELSPAAFDPLTAVPIRITYGPRTNWHLGERIFNDVETLRGLMRHELAAPDQAMEVIVETPLDLLQLGGQVDIVDTPGVGSHDRFDIVTARVLRELDAVVLVVRYPALFTKLTRHLLHELEGDISKLFVVWNLDASCAELTAEERAGHADTLRREVAGAHELYTVDARAGLRAVEAGNAKAITASGLADFSEALARFASSEKRQVSALRQVAKRMRGWLEEAEASLSARHAEVAENVRLARSRIHEVEQEAAAKERALRHEFSALQSSLARIAADRTAKAKECAASLRQRLRSARWRWVRKGRGEELRAAVARLVSEYAGRAHEVSREAGEAVDRVLAPFDPSVVTQVRPLSEPHIPDVFPAEREERSRTGRMQWLRRALWRNWYLPGLGELERLPIDEDLTAQEDWFAAVTGAAEETARGVMEERLAEIHRELASRVSAIKQETCFDQQEAELAALGAHLPVVAAERATIDVVARDARALVD